jgi:hypothetical protein
MRWRTTVCIKLDSSKTLMHLLLVVFRRGHHHCDPHTAKRRCLSPAYNDCWIIADPPPPLLLLLRVRYLVLDDCWMDHERNTSEGGCPKGTGPNCWQFDRERFPSGTVISVRPRLLLPEGGIGLHACFYLKPACMWSNVNSIPLALSLLSYQPFVVLASLHMKVVPRLSNTCTV